MSDTIDCAYCRDSGMPPGNVYDVAQRVVVLCVCWTQRISAWAVPKANIYKRYLTASFDMIPNERFVNQAQVIERCRAYVADWLHVKHEGICLSILGSEPGMGKSHLASAVCNALIKTYWTKSVESQDVCLFINVNAWFESWPSLYARYPGTEDRFNDSQFLAEKAMLAERESRMRSTDLLVLDDLTKFNVSHRENVQKLFGVVEHRVINGLPILVTENADSWDQVAAKLGVEFGPMIVDRLVRNGDAIFVEMPEVVKRGKKK